MMLFRRANPDDVNAIHQLAEHSGIGMTTLPKDKDLLLSRLSWANDSFLKPVGNPENEYYFFVLENPDTGKVVGTSAIDAATGYSTPFYSYKLSKRTNISHSLGIRSDYEILELVNDYQGKTEICTLFLEPKYRRDSNGLLLSRARFLFIAHYPTRFSSTVFAEMRGISDKWGKSPFWKNVGQHFFHISFAQADSLTLSTNKQFIADLMPRNPLYVKLLDPDAQAVIGKPHESTIPAMNILMREGFRYNNYVDIFDAGPTIEAPTHSIQTVKSSRIMIVRNLSDKVSSKKFLLSNTKLDFRATISEVIFNDIDGSCIISKETAKLLNISSGDCVRIASLQLEQSPFINKASS